MKKLIVLTSVFALAACGGGSGGKSGYGERPTVDPARHLVSDDVYTSNGNVTSMASRILVARDGSNRSFARSSSRIVPFMGDDYDEYDLSDINFNIADEGFGGVVRFEVDENKQITNFYVLDDERELTTVDGRLVYESDNDDLYIEGGVLKKSNPEATLTGPDDDGIYHYESEDDDLNGSFMINGDDIVQLYEGDESSIRMYNDKMYPIMNFTRTDDEAFTFDGMVNAETGEAEATLTYHSIGKKLGLKYSDFGYFQLASDEDVDRPVSIIGGYDVKRIDRNNLPTTTTTFSGRAHGSVIALRGGNDGQELPIEDNNAELVFSKNTSKLTAHFNNWYDMVYTETYGDDATKSVTYSNYTDTPVILKDEFDQDVETPNYFRMLGDVYDSEHDVYISDGEEGHTIALTTISQNGDEFDNIQSDIRQYGDNNIASEMVGLIQVRDCAGNTCGDIDDVRQDEVRMNLSFGGGNR